MHLKEEEDQVMVVNGRRTLVTHGEAGGTDTTGLGGKRAGTSRWPSADREADLGRHGSPRASSFVSPRLGLGWGGEGNTFLTCKFPTTPGLQFRGRPGELGSKASRGKLQGVITKPGKV